MLTLAILKTKKSSSPLSGNKAFTLIEVMISLALVAGIAVMIASRFSRPNDEIKESITELMILTKKSFQYAQIKNLTYRIVIDMTTETEDGDSKRHAYWVESAAGSQLIPDPEEEEQTFSDDDDAPRSAFSLASDVMKRPKNLGEGFTFKGVSFGGRDEITEGVAYLYFFPQGYTEESLLKITHAENEQNWSLLVNPLTGISELINKEVSLKDLKQGK